MTVFAPGTEWAGYTLLRCLGHGMEGAVYEARDTRGRTCALKIPFDNPSSRLRLALEAHQRAHLASLGAPNVNPMLAYGLDEPMFLASELAPRGSLQRMVEEAPLAPELAFAIASHLRRWVIELAARGVWYFDVRADNLVAAGEVPLEPGTVQAIDFGAAAPVSPLLRFERWPFGASPPPRGRGWAYAPFEGTDFDLPFALLCWHLARGRPLVPIRQLRGLLHATSPAMSPADLPSEWPADMRAWLESVLCAAPRDLPAPKLADLAPDPALLEWLRADSPALRVTGTEAALAALGRALEHEPARYSRILPVRLPSTTRALPEVIPIAVLEQVRVQSRFIPEDALREVFSGWLREPQLMSIGPRWTPLLWARLGGLALPSPPAAVDLDSQRGALGFMLGRLADHRPVFVITLSDRGHDAADAFFDAFAANPSAKVRWLHLCDADALLRPRAPLAMQPPSPP